MCKLTKCAHPRVLDFQDTGGEDSTRRQQKNSEFPVLAMYDVCCQYLTDIKIKYSENMLDTLFHSGMHKNHLNRQICMQKQIT